MPVRVKPKEIRDALLAYLDECAEKGVQPADETYEFYRVMDKRLGMDYGALYAWDRARAENKFKVQVLAQLNSLAKEGRLVKTGERRDIRFYTPEGAQRAAAEAAAAHREYLAQEQRITAIRTRLALLSIGEFGRGSVITLGLHGWEELLDLAEDGKVSRGF